MPFKLTEMEKNDFVLSSDDKIIPKIHIIRGIQVMLDSDLAAFYGYETKYFNRQVNNNLNRFDEDFRFQLTEDEVKSLRCKNFTSSWGGTRYQPYVFTEQGVYMLMTVLKGELAVRQSKTDYLYQSGGGYGSVSKYPHEFRKQPSTFSLKKNMKN